MTYAPTIALFAAVALFFAGTKVWDRFKPQKDPSPTPPEALPAGAEPQVTPVEALFDAPEETHWGGDDLDGRGGVTPGPGYTLYRPGKP